MTYRMLIVAAVSLASAPQATPIKPIVVPMFESGGPAFVLECRNATGAPLQPGQGRRSQMWLDGVLDRPMGEGGSGGKPLRHRLHSCHPAHIFVINSAISEAPPTKLVFSIFSITHFIHRALHLSILLH